MLFKCQMEYILLLIIQESYQLGKLELMCRLMYTDTMTHFQQNILKDSQQKKEYQQLGGRQLN